MAANLTYYINEGVLAGTVGRSTLHLIALSGGAAGSTRNPTAPAMNNPYMTGLVTTGSSGAANHVHGGPIPPGRYTIERPSQHPHLGLSARLVNPPGRAGGRDGFYIHGRGPHGSDGCIVPTDRNQFQQLMTALQQSNGGVLIVQETMDGSRFA